MANKNLFSAREEEIFKILRELKDLEMIIIGGYAVNTYTLPRFSVDCDIVIRNEYELKKFERILDKNSFVARNSKGFNRYEKKIENNFSASVDIMVRNVNDRMTGANFSYEWILNNSKHKVLKGKTINEELRLRIINIDALLVMKITSCRATDMRDVFMMLPNADNREWIKTEISLRCEFKDRISKIIEKIKSKQFKDGLSGVYGSLDQKIFDKHKNALDQFNPVL